MLAHTPATFARSRLAGSFRATTVREWSLRILRRDHLFTGALWGRHGNRPLTSCSEIFFDRR